MKAFMLLLTICSSPDSCQTYFEGWYATAQACNSRAQEYFGKVSHAHCIRVRGEK